MAGVKGRSGGARPNSGGKRPGAGRKPKAKPVESANVAAAPAQPAGEAPAAEASLEGMDMLQMLQAVALGKVMATTLQVRAAIAAVQYTHTKRHDGGKKDEQEAAAKKTATGRFKPSAPPRLVANNG